MKRKLALIMAGAMVGTMVPAIPAHAASDNRVDRVVQVKSDDTLAVTNAPNLVIKNE